MLLTKPAAAPYGWSPRLSRIPIACRLTVATGPSLTTTTRENSGLTVTVDCPWTFGVILCGKDVITLEV